MITLLTLLLLLLLTTPDSLDVVNLVVGVKNYRIRILSYKIEDKIWNILSASK